MAETHQTNVEELAEVKADCWVASHRLCLQAKKAALERTAKITAGHQQACAFCTRVRGN